MDRDSTFITRVVLENYKSIAECDVRLGPLTFLVGRNGAGKSNFLDALRFVSVALRSGIDQALRDRGNFQDVRYRGAVLDTSVVVCLDMVLPEDMKGRYSLSLAPDHGAGYRVAEERCSIEYRSTGHDTAGFHIRDGMYVNHPNHLKGVPAVQPKQLYLPLWPDLDGRSVYDGLAGMVFYNPIPSHMRSPVRHDVGETLLPDGSNCASVLLRLAANQPDALERITEYLRAVLPGLKRATGKALGDYDVLEFYQGSEDQERAFPPTAMSDGTLHALAVLTALYQDGFLTRRAHPVIGIEEPEAALHPAATAVLRDAITDAMELSQLIITTQSADLLDDKDLSADTLLAVASTDGLSRIGRLEKGQRSIIVDHLASAGELLRTSNFRPISMAMVDAGSYERG